MASPRSVAWSALGAVAGVAGLVASRCAGGGCSTCFACAVPGVSAVALALLNPRREGARSTAPSPGDAVGSK